MKAEPGEAFLELDRFVQYTRETGQSIVSSRLATLARSILQPPLAKLEVLDLIGLVIRSSITILGQATVDFASALQLD